MNTNIETCYCGEVLHPFCFADQGDGQPYYDAWPATDQPAQVYAASRQDVINWRTDFRPPAHDICTPARAQPAIVEGACRETFAPLT